MTRMYLRKNVLEAAKERLEWIFERYENIVVSTSGGKDSTLLFDLAYKKAEALGRKVHAFFLDQEAEYEATIEVIREIMARPGTVPHWFQVPCYMTSAVAYDQEMLYAWGPGETWMREKDPLAIHEIEGDYPQRFYPFIDWFESRFGPDTCFLVGLRAEESLNRYRAVIKGPGVEDILWSTRGKEHILKFYPIYDWGFEDVFLYLYREKVKYNRVYDFMHSKDRGMQITKYRVSNLIHEKAFRSLVSLQEFEPDTFERLQRRLKGVHTAAIYAEEGTVYNARVLPERFDTWREYRDYLLQTMPDNGRRERFAGRFAGQGESESIYRQQCRQLLVNDWENNLPVSSKEPAEDWRKKWMELL